MLEDLRKPNGEMPFEGAINYLKSRVEKKLNYINDILSSIDQTTPSYNVVPNYMESYDTKDRINWVSSSKITNYEVCDVDEIVFREDENSDTSENYNVIVGDYSDPTILEFTQEGYLEYMNNIQSFGMPNPAFIGQGPMMFMGNNYVGNPCIQTMPQQQIFQPNQYPVMGQQMPTGYMYNNQTVNQGMDNNNQNTNKECNYDIIINDCPHMEIDSDQDDADADDDNQEENDNNREEIIIEFPPDKNFDYSKLNIDQEYIDNNNQNNINQGINNNQTVNQGYNINYQTMSQQQTFQPHPHPITGQMPTGYMDVNEVRRLIAEDQALKAKNNNQNINQGYMDNNNQTIPQQSQQQTFQPHPHPITGQMPTGYMDVNEVRRLIAEDQALKAKNNNQNINQGYMDNNNQTVNQGMNNNQNTNYQDPIYANRHIDLHSKTFIEAEKETMPQNNIPQNNMAQQNQFTAPIQQQPIYYNPYNNPNYNYILQQSYAQQQAPFNPCNVSAPGNYIFAPVILYPQNQYGAYQQPPVDYHNPFPEYNNRQQTLYYGYNNQYMPFMSVQMREQMIQQNTAIEKLRYKIVCAGAGIEYKEEEADEMFNPMNKANQMTDDDRIEMNHWNFIMRAKYFESHPGLCQSEPELTALYLQTYLRNYHEMFDNHSLCEFLEEDYPRLMREFWIAENVKRNGRDLNSTYDSDSYKELLKLHNASNPYINRLLNDFNTNQYDNNNTPNKDEDVGVLEMLQHGARPDYKSSYNIIDQIPEIQKMRAEFMNSIAEQMNAKYNSQTEKINHNLIEKTKTEPPVNQKANQDISSMLEQNSTGVINSDGDP